MRGCIIRTDVLLKDVIPEEWVLSVAFTPDSIGRWRRLASLERSESDGVPKYNEWSSAAARPFQPHAAYESQRAELRRPFRRSLVSLDGAFQPKRSGPVRLSSFDWNWVSWARSLHCVWRRRQTFQLSVQRFNSF